MGNSKRMADESFIANRLRFHVETLAGLIGPRHLGRPSSLEATAVYIEREFVAMDYIVERQPYDVNGTMVSNLIIEKPGKTQPVEIVILGAHYDTVPTTPGADDNASAVAMLIEVARILQRNSGQRTIRFAAFTCEEPPHFYTQTMGSQMYARRCRQAGERIIGMLAMEMVGFYTTSENGQQAPFRIPSWLRWAFPRRGNFIASVGNLRSWCLLRAFRQGFRQVVRFPLFSIALPEKIHAIRLSDNSSFWDQGYAALMLTDTSFLRNPHYHEPTDTPDTLDYDKMAQVTMGVAGGLAKLAKCKVQWP
jgi:Zn-dependent M28 family amino/carboxypeptidase